MVYIVPHTAHHGKQVEALLCSKIHIYNIDNDINLDELKYMLYLTTTNLKMGFGKPKEITPVPRSDFFKGAFRGGVICHENSFVRSEMIGF